MRNDACLKIINKVEFRELLSYLNLIHNFDVIFQCINCCVFWVNKIDAFY